MKYSNLVLEETSIEELISKDDFERIESFLIDTLKENKEFFDPLGFFSDEITIDRYAPYKWISAFRRLKKLPKDKHGVHLSLAFTEETNKFSFIVSGFNFLHEKTISLNSVNSVDELLEVCEKYINEIIGRERDRKELEIRLAETLKKFVNKIVKFLRSIKMTNVSISKISFQPITSFGLVKIYAEIRYGLASGGFRRTVFPTASYNYETKQEEYLVNHVSWFSAEENKEKTFNNSEEFLTTGFEEWKANFIKAAQVRQRL